MVVWAMSASAIEPCPDPEASLRAAEDAVVEGRTRDARDRLAEVEETLGCRTSTPELLARFWVAEGAASFADGDLSSADLSFAAARRVAPELWTQDFGSKARAAWSASWPPAGRPATGVLELDPHPVQNRGLLDGSPSRWPSETSAGLHLVQLEVDGQIRFGRFVRVDAGTLELVLSGAAEPLPALPPVSNEPKDPPDLLALGAGAVALAGASLALWAVADGQVRDAPDLGALRRAQDRKVGFGAASVTLGAVGLLSLGGEILF